MSENEPQPVGEPFKENTVEEPCHNCGVVQEMDLYAQAYEDHPHYHFPKGDCPVCGNDHAENPPW